MQLKSAKTHNAFIDINDEICTQGKVPKFDYNPKYVPFYHKYCQHGTNIPGTWTGSENMFTHLTYVSKVNEFKQISTSSAWADENEAADMLTSKALVSAFGVLLPTACYLGFEPFNDPTQPLCTNVIIGDGRNFKLASYQLNKTELVDCNANSEVSFIHLVGLLYKVILLTLKLHRIAASVKFS